MRNPFVGSFNGHFRDECLNLHLFFLQADGREKLEERRQDYNTERPHSALGDRPSTDYAQRG